MRGAPKGHLQDVKCKIDAFDGFFNDSGRFIAKYLMVFFSFNYGLIKMKI